MPSLKVPSGLELTPNGLFRQVANLTQSDLRFIFESSKGKKYRKPVGELLGKAFAGQYSRRRQALIGTHSDFWKINRGAYRKKFIEAAINARIQSVNTEMLILRAEALARSKKLVYPSPFLVCGPFVFGEVINGWSAGGMTPPPPDEVDELEVEDHGEGSWIWQPGYKWDDTTERFVRDENS